MSIFSSKFFGGKKNSNNRVASRKLRLEALEERQLLDAAGLFAYGSDSAYVASVLATTGDEQLAAPTLEIGGYSSNSVEVTVGHVDNASGYKLRYSTSSNFASGVYTVDVTEGFQTVTNLPTTLNIGTTYYFQVQATAAEGG